MYEVAANAVEVVGATRNISLKNNIFWAAGAGHYAVTVADTAQLGFTSDYNLINATGGALPYFWQNPFNTLTDFRFDVGQETHSLTGDPRFVDPAGADAVRGYTDFAGPAVPGIPQQDVYPRDERPAVRHGHRSRRQPRRVRQQLPRPAQQQPVVAVEPARSISPFPAPTRSGSTPTGRSGSPSAGN